MSIEIIIHAKEGKMRRVRLQKGVFFVFVSERQVKRLWGLLKKEDPKFSVEIEKTFYNTLQDNYKKEYLL